MDGWVVIFLLCVVALAAI